MIAIQRAASKPTPQTLMVTRALYNLSLDTTWVDPADDDRMITWIRDVWSRISSFTGNAGVYLNFAGLGEDSGELAHGAYGTNIERLTRAKRQYDPGNLFNVNVNIKP
jgi:FAD/FMN-containing dehydrogenase